MTYDARQVANWFVTRAQRDGRTLSIMSLLKLAYIAHGWHLEIFSEPLFKNSIEAWKYGPVVPKVYNAFRKQGVNVSKPVSVAKEQPMSREDDDFLEQVWNIYGHLSPFKLSDITHAQGGPWDVAAQMGGNYARIPDSLIQPHYAEMRRRAEAEG